jgi:hypothetical protein
MQALPATAYLEYRYSTHATYASISPVKLRANHQGCHYITRCNIDFTLQLHLACDIDIYIAIVLHVAMSHDVAAVFMQGRY